MFNFNMGSQKQIIGVAVTPNIGVEVIQVDSKTGGVQKYAQRPLSYNSQKREIEDYVAFKGAIIDMCTELEINIKSSFYVVLPNIYFGFIDLPSSVVGEEIENVLLAKAEESYVFKKAEPAIAHANAGGNVVDDSKYLVYSAIQKEVVERIRDIFVEMGANLVGIEGSNTAVIKAIEHIRLADDVIKSESNWDILLVNSNNYALFALSGNNIFDYVEVPLALKSLSFEEAYQAISTSIAQNLPNYPAKKLLIVSQTDDISAEVLRTQITFDEDIEMLECNKYTKTTRFTFANAISPNDAKGISLSALGAAVSQTTKMACKLNVLGKNIDTSSYKLIPLFGQNIVLTPELASNLAMALAVVLGLFFGGIWLSLTGITNAFTSSAASKEEQLKTIQAEIATYSTETAVVNIEDLIDKIISNNKKTAGYYDSLSTEIPKNVWLTYFYSKDGENVAIEGLSLGINDIYEYYKGLKNSAPASTIQLKRLKIITDMTNGSYDPTAANEVKLYDFEISNTVSKKNAPPPSTNAEGEGGDPNAQQNTGAEQGPAGSINSQDVPPPPPIQQGAPVQLEPAN